MKKLTTRLALLAIALPLVLGAGMGTAGADNVVVTVPTPPEPPTPAWVWRDLCNASDYACIKEYSNICIGAGETTTFTESSVCLAIGTD